MKMDREVTVVENSSTVQKKKGSPPTSSSAHEHTGSHLSGSDLDEQTKRLKYADQRHPKFWFRDGNVVIRVEGQVFRLHSSILGAKSPYFTKLFSVKNEGEIKEVIEGCEVFDLRGESRDFMALLDALYGNLTRLCLVGNVAPSFFTISCLLRASHKWDVPAYKAWAIEALSHRWPSKLNQPDQEKISDFSRQIIVLCRECDVTSLLKPAFYGLLRLTRLGTGNNANSEEVEEGIVTSGIIENGEGNTEGIGEDAVTHNSSNKPLLHSYYHDRSKGWMDRDTTLSSNDTSLAIYLLEYATQTWIAFFRQPPSYLFLSDKASHSSRTAKCSQIFKELWPIHVTGSGFVEDGWFDPLGALQTIKDINWEAEGICASCASECRARWEKKRRNIWEEIDRKLGLVDK
ncbi:hypothetical protein BOTBODRAFT_68750 [Botryobasidium botryosum FD-172 SS1]|uniref:BTB domain-containing protein n=1 Tax=Botryobasidium botryosum (strain FD-172 SS1) TaxID=930990 RepID=A0A067M2Z3_BOTB1|nr:hypothetical protein BOTBODRAFT_68750 [Botryobasidium botryosum FD-172 SS1]